MGALLGKNDNVEGDGNNDDDNSVTVEKSGRTSNDENRASRLKFLTFIAKIAFTQLKKVLIKALLLHYFEPD